MSTTKIAITIEDNLLQRLDKLVVEQRFPSRSQAIEEAVQEKVSRLERSRLARECAKLDPEFEQKLADEGLEEDFTQWPEY
ncbi:MAG: CopG family ribbon-helix-helix protein [Ardenticatenaceae bacterium]